MAKKKPKDVTPVSVQRAAGDPGDQTTMTIAGPADPSKQRAEQKTDLEVFLFVHLPRWWQKRGNRVTWILTALLVVAAVWVWSGRAQEEQQRQLAQSAASAWDIFQLSRGVLADPGTGVEVVLRRREQYQSIERTIETVLAANAAAEQRLIALLTRGELNYLLSLLPPQSLAGTQPADAGAGLSHVEYAERAEAAYQQILREHPQATAQVMTAHFGLAAIAENRGDFDSAGKHYDQIVAHPSAEPIHKELAVARRRLLGELRPLTTQPATRPG